MAGAPRRRFGAPARRVVADALAAKAQACGQHLGIPGNEHCTVSHAQRRIAAAIERSDRLVHAIGVGRKVEGGVEREEVCVRFYVSQKLPRRLIPDRHFIPEKIEGIPTDVIEAAPAFLSGPVPPACSLKRRERRRPLLGGISGSQLDVSAGTIGLLCRSTRPEEQGLRLLLSNHHVLTDYGLAPLGTVILQPSIADGGIDADRIGVLHRTAGLGAAGVDPLDAAVALLDGTVEASAEICSIGAPTGTRTPEVGLSIKKHARTTGLTQGTIDDVSTDALVPAAEDGSGPTTLFRNQLRVVARPGEIFALRGDSGAAILTSTRKVVGLLFGCALDGSFAYACPIEPIFQSLELKLW